MFWIFFSCTRENQRAGIEIVFYDQVTGKPLEGVIAVVQNPRRAFRSNQQGVCQLNRKEVKADINIFSRSHFPLDTIINESCRIPLRQRITFTQEESSNNIKIDTLRGQYGNYRSNNDLLFYHLDIAIDIYNQSIKGSNLIRLLALEPLEIVQIDLWNNLHIDSILFNQTPLTYKRVQNSVFISLSKTIPLGTVFELDFYYSGNPLKSGRFGGFSFDTDSLGRPWIYTACQSPGASVWWPNKDQFRDEVDSMRLSVTVPPGLIDVSNGKFLGIDTLDSGYIKYNWYVNYPINNYSVSVNVGNYVFFEENKDGLDLNFYALDYHLEEAQRQFQQVSGMLTCFQEKLGSYPFRKDGYKLLEVPYSGMEHQSAVTYGNLFKNGYLGRDWTGVGISNKFDFIIIHESGHEWYGNSISCADYSDAWIQEGWCTYAEAIYVECNFGKKDALKYINGYKEKVSNKTPVIGRPSTYEWPTQDIYFKGALFLNTLRFVVDDDTQWFDFIRDYTKQFSYQNIYVVDVINYMNKYFGRDFSRLFFQYLYTNQLPELLLRQKGEELYFKWENCVKHFEMPVELILHGGISETLRINPTESWQSIRIEEYNSLTVNFDKFYIEASIF